MNGILKTKYALLSKLRARLTLFCSDAFDLYLHYFSDNDWFYLKLSLAKNVLYHGVSRGITIVIRFMFTSYANIEKQLFQKIVLEKLCWWSVKQLITLFIAMGLNESKALSKVYPDIFESATFSFRIQLPSTRMQFGNKSEYYWIRSPEWKKQKINSQLIR